MLLEGLIVDDGWLIEFVLMTFNNRRVCLILLQGHNQFKIKQQKYKVSEELKTGQARVLFGEYMLW